jgi:hypothetical protein
MPSLADGGETRRVLAVDYSCETPGAPESGTRDGIAWRMGEDVRADDPEDTLGEPILL